MAVFFIIFLHELKLLWRNLSRILAVILFFLITFFVFSMIGANPEQQGANLSFSILISWFSLLASLVFSSSEFFKKDHEDGSAEQLIIFCQNFEIVVLAKMLASWCCNCLPILLSLFCWLIFADVGVQFLSDFMMVTTLASLAISFICNFCGSLSTLENSASMIGIIALPLIIPILLLAYQTPQDTNVANVSLIAGITIFTCIISIFATAKIVKIAAE